jgi:hypothetical protein
MPKLTKRKASNLLNLGKWVKKRRVNEGDKESHKNDKKKENVSHFSIYLSCCTLEMAHYCRLDNVKVNLSGLGAHPF